MTGNDDIYFRLFTQEASPRYHRKGRCHKREKVEHVWKRARVSAKGKEQVLGRMYANTVFVNDNEWWQRRWWWSLTLKIINLCVVPSYIWIPNECSEEKTFYGDDDCDPLLISMMMVMMIVMMMMMMMMTKMMVMMTKMMMMVMVIRSWWMSWQSRAEWAE